MKIFDSLDKIKKDLEKDTITMYVCGPTVYNYVHIGNLRPIIIFDVFHRYFLYKNKKVIFINNITDVDDKIINEAINTNKTEAEISTFFYNHYYDLLIKLNINMDKIFPKVSENIQGIIDYIKLLNSKKLTYVNNESVYFNVNKIENYGCLSNNETKNLVKNNRIEYNHDKDNQSDFVLWKKTDKGINWNSDFGFGRPGWHTECSYFINKYFGEQVDIHGGGIDLKFPHHENENAQNYGLYKKNLANIWCHVGHLLINNQKMSKSLNNFILAKDLIENYDYKAIKWMFYQCHYTKPFNFKYEIINEMQNQINKIENEINKAKLYLLINNYDLFENLYKSMKLNKEIDDLFNDNFNFPEIVTKLLEIIKQFSKLIKNKIWNDLQNNIIIILSTFKILGIEFENKFTEDTIKIINEWNLAVEKKDFKKSDEIRKILILKNIL